MTRLVIANSTKSTQPPPTVTNGMCVFASLRREIVSGLGGMELMVVVEGHQKKQKRHGCDCGGVSGNSWPSAHCPLLYCWPVMVLIPLQTSLMLFLWSLHSSFLLILPFASLIFTFSSHRIIVTCSLLPALKALFFTFRMALMSLVFQITMDSLSFDSGVHTDDHAVCEALSKPISVLSMQITECLPFCHLKTALKCLKLQIFDTLELFSTSSWNFPPVAHSVWNAWKLSSYTQVTCWVRS